MKARPNPNPKKNWKVGNECAIYPHNRGYHAARIKAVDATNGTCVVHDLATLNDATVALNCLFEPDRSFVPMDAIPWAMHPEGD